MIFLIIYQTHGHTSLTNIGRVWMVQTESQYICIHQCLLTVLEGNESTNSISPTHVNQGYEGMSFCEILNEPSSTNDTTFEYLFLIVKEKCGMLVW